jgi:transglutaminase-like putative cysteine protease
MSLVKMLAVLLTSILLVTVLPLHWVNFVAAEQSGVEEVVLEFKGDVRVNGMYASTYQIRVSEAAVKSVKYVIRLNSTDIKSGVSVYSQVIVLRGQVKLSGNTTFRLDEVYASSRETVNPTLVLIPTIAGYLTIAVRASEISGKPPSALKLTIEVKRLAGLTDSPPTFRDIESDQYTPVPTMFQFQAREYGNSPVKLFEYVRNNVIFDAYWGVMRGPIRTYYDLYGNSFDQASLLVALLRAAVVPARYVYGILGLKTERVMDMLGVYNRDAVFKILDYSYLLDQYDSEKDIIWIRHVWVRAFINNSWVDLDPSIKKITRRTHSPVEGVFLPPMLSAQDEFTKTYKDYMSPLNAINEREFSMGVWIDEVHGLVRPEGERVVLYVGDDPPEYVAGLKFEYPRWSDQKGYDFANGNYSFQLLMPVAAGYRLTARFVPADKSSASYINSLPKKLLTEGIDLKRARMRLQFLLNGIIISIGDAGYPGYISPVYMTLIVKLPDNTTLNRRNTNLWANGYMSYVPSFVKTRYDGEVGMYGASIRLFTELPPELLKNVDQDELYGRMAYLQGRLYRVGGWHMVENIFNYSYILVIHPFTITQSAAYSMRYDGKRVFISPGYVHALAMNAIFAVFDPLEGEVKLTPDLMFRRYVADSLMEGVAVQRGQLSSPFSTAHAFYYAMTKGRRVLFVDKDNVTSLKGIVPEGVYNYLVNKAGKSNEFYAYVPSSLASFDILRIHATNITLTDPPIPRVASDKYAYLYMIPAESPWEWGWGTIIQASSDVLSGGGIGVLTESGQVAADASADSLSSNGQFASDPSETSKESSEKILSNLDSAGYKDAEKLVEEAKKVCEEEGVYSQRCLELMAEALGKIDGTLKKLAEDVWELTQYSEAISGGILKNPDGSIMTYSQALKFMLSMGLDERTRNEVLERQQRYIQQIQLGYIEFEKQIDGKTYVVRVNLQTSATYSGMGFPPPTPESVTIKLADGKAMGTVYDRYDNEVTKSLGQFGAIEFEATDMNQVEKLVDETIRFINQHNGQVSTNLLNQKQNQKQPLTGEEQIIAGAQQYLKDGVLFIDPPFLELSIEDSLGNIAGYHPDHGISASGNMLRYSGYGSYPQFLELYGLRPGILLLNVYGTDPKGVNAQLYITYNWGNVKSILTIPLSLKISYKELVKIPIVIDNQYQLRVGTPMPGLRLNITAETTTSGGTTMVKGVVLDQYGSNGVPNATVSISLFEPDGKVKPLANITTGPDGTFSYTLKTSKAGINYVHAVATKEKMGPATKAIPFVVHGILRILGPTELGEVLKGRKVEISLAGGNTKLQFKLNGSNTAIKLPAGRYEITFPTSFEEKGWKLERGKASLTFKLDGESTIRLEDLYTIYVAVNVKSNVGKVEGSGFYRIGERVTLRATAPSGYLFKGWQGDIKSTENPLTFTASKPISLEALWEQEKIETVTKTTTIETQTTTQPRTTTTKTENIVTTTTYPATATSPETPSTFIILAVTAVSAAVIAAMFFTKLKRHRPRPPPPPPPP